MDTYTNVYITLDISNRWDKMYTRGLFLVACTGLILLALAVGTTAGDTIIIDDDGGAWADYTSFKTAINGASDGDTLLVYNGTYEESVWVYKELTIIGNGTDDTILDTQNLGEGIDIEADNVSVSGLYLMNSTTDTGILVDADNVTVHDCIVSNYYYGIQISTDENLSVTDVVVNGSSGFGFYGVWSFNISLDGLDIWRTTSAAIRLDYCSNVTFTGGQVNDSMYLVQVNHGDNVTFFDMMMNESYGGLSFSSIEDFEMHDATIDDIGGEAIYVQYSSRGNFTGFRTNNTDGSFSFLDSDNLSMYDCRFSNAQGSPHVHGTSYWDYALGFGDDNYLDGEVIEYYRDQEVDIADDLLRWLMLVNCSGSLDNLTIGPAMDGMIIAYSHDLTVSDIYFMDCNYGADVHYGEMQEWSDVAAVNDTRLLNFQNVDHITVSELGSTSGDPLHISGGTGALVKDISYNNTDRLYATGIDNGTFRNITYTNHDDRAIRMTHSDFVLIEELYAENVSVALEMEYVENCTFRNITVIGGSHSIHGITVLRGTSNLYEWINVSNVLLYGVYGNYEEYSYYSDLNLTDCDVGFYIWHSHYDTGDSIISNSRLNIYISSSTFNTVSNFTTTGGEYGVAIELAQNNVFRDGTADSASISGIESFSSQSNRLINITAKKSTADVKFRWSSGEMLESCRIRRGTTGLSSLSSTFDIFNTSIKNTTGKLIDMDDSYGYLTQTEFNASNVDVDANSYLEASNFLHMYINDSDGTPVQYIEVKLKSDVEYPYLTDHWGGSDPTTDETGLIEWLRIPYMGFNGSSTGSYNYTNLTVKLGPWEVMRDVDMNTTHWENFTRPANLTIYVDANNTGDPDEDGSISHPFNTIQEGIDGATIGDKVKVLNGTYKYDFDLNRPILVEGSGNNTILAITSMGTYCRFTGGGTLSNMKARTSTGDLAFSVEGPGVNISNVYFKGEGRGVRVGVNDTTLHNLSFNGSSTAIEVSHMGFDTIHNLLIWNVRIYNESDAWAITLRHVENSTLRHIHINLTNGGILVNQSKVTLRDILIEDIDNKPITLDWSTGCILRDIEILHNGWDLTIEGEGIEHWRHSVEGLTRNGTEILYLVDETVSLDNVTTNGIWLINCTGTVENMNFKYVPFPLRMRWCEDLNIFNITVNRSIEGLNLYECYDIDFEEIVILRNDGFGIYLMRCENITIIDGDFDRGQAAVFSHGSNWIEIRDIRAIVQDIALYLEFTDNLTVYNVTTRSCMYSAYMLFIDNGTISEIDDRGSGIGFYLGYIGNSTLEDLSTYNSSSEYSVVMMYLDNVTVRGLHIEDASNKSFEGGVFTNVTFEDVYIKNSTAIGMVWENLTYVVLRNVTVIESSGYGIMLTAGNHTTVENVTVKRCTYGFIFYSMFNSSATNISVSRSDFVAAYLIGLYDTNVTNIVATNSTIGLYLAYTFDVMVTANLTKCENGTIGGYMNRTTLQAYFNKNDINMNLTAGFLNVTDTYFGNTTKKSIILNDALVNATNCTFFKEKFDTTYGALRIYNPLWVYVETENGDPVVGCEIEVEVNGTVIYSTVSYGGDDPVTDDNGTIEVLYPLYRSYWLTDTPITNITNITVMMGPWWDETNATTDGPTIVNFTRPANLTIHVDDSNAGDPDMDGSYQHPFDTIQRGLDNATNGDTVRVFSGTYEESVRVERSVDIIGNGSTTVIDHYQPWSTQFRILAPNVTVEDIQFISGHNAIFINQNNVTLRDLNIECRERGIWLNDAYGLVFKDLNIRTTHGDDDGHGIASYNSGFDLRSSTINASDACVRASSGSFFIQNVVMEGMDGMDLGTLGPSTFRNIEINVSRYGFEIDLDTDYGDIVIDNVNCWGIPVVVRYNETDVMINGTDNISYLALVNCVNVTLYDVIISNQGYGLNLVNCSDVEIINANLTDNQFGFVLWLCDNVTIYDITALDSLASGAEIYNCTNITIERMHLFDSGSIYFNWNDNITIWDAYLGGSYTGIMMYESKGLYVYNTTFNVTGNALNFVDSDTMWFEDCVFMNTLILHTLNDVTIVASMIGEANYGMNIFNSSMEVYDTTFYNNSVDLRVSSGTVIEFYNATINLSRIQFNEAGPVLTFYNYLDIMVNSSDGPAVEGAEINVTCNGTTHYATPFYGGVDPVTDMNGTISMIDVPYLRITQHHNNTDYFHCTADMAFRNDSEMKVLDMNTSGYLYFTILNHVPIVTVDPVTGEQSGYVNITFDLFDDNHDPIDIYVMFWNDTMAPMTANVLGVVDDLDANGSGISHMIIWRSNLDLSGIEGVFNLSITPNDAYVNGSAYEIVIDINNSVLANLPPYAGIEDVPDGSSGTVQINITLFDDNEDLVNITIEHRIDLEINWTATTFTGDNMNLSADGDGENHTFQLDTTMYLPDEMGTIQLRFNVSDGTDHVIFYKNISIDNRPPNDPPQVSLVFPNNGSTVNELNITLSWIGSDLNDDNLTYTLYFEDDVDPMAFYNGTGTSMAMMNLTNGTTYHWYVKVDDGRDKARSETRWFEINTSYVDQEPPSIGHFPVTDSNETEAIDIVAEVLDLSAIANVTLYYRVPLGTWMMAIMNGVNSTYTGTIPGANVTTAGVEYYIFAADEWSNNATHPEIGVHMVTVVSPIDNTPPVIYHNNITAAIEGDTIVIRARITDTDNDTIEAVLHYRHVGDAIYTMKNMTGDGENFTVNIPSSFVTDDIEYYILASDGTDETTHPADIDDPVEIDVLPEERLLTLTPLDLTSGARVEVKAKINGTGNLDLSLATDPSNDNVSDIGIFFKIKTTGFVGIKWINITVTYVTVPDGIDESKLRMFYYDEIKLEWVKIANSGVDTANKLIWANLTHLTIFAPLDTTPVPGDGGDDDDEESSMMMIMVIVVVLVVVMLLLIMLLRPKQKGGEEMGSMDDGSSDGEDDDMFFCPECGYEVEDEYAVDCPECGADLDAGPEEDAGDEGEAEDDEASDEAGKDDEAPAADEEDTPEEEAEKDSSEDPETDPADEEAETEDEKKDEE